MSNLTENLTILVVDDDDAMRTLLKSAIMQWGFQVKEASDGEQAWQIMQEPTPPRLLILDWRMPKMDGITLCKLIREKINFHPYIIFLTQVSGSTNIFKGFDAGADEFLLKPINFIELRARVYAGEKIVKYLNIIAEKDGQIKEQYDHIQTLLTIVSLLLRDSNEKKK